MELAVTLRYPQKRTELFGAGDRYLRQIRDAFGVQMQTRSQQVRVVGPPADTARAASVLETLQDRIASGQPILEEHVEQAIDEVNRADGRTDPGSIRVFSRDPVVPKTPGQQAYVQAMLERDLVFCLGPAGTGKTYLAVAVAVHLLKSGRIKRIALVRPAVEAGEKLGFLPGDLQQKVNPYLRPLFDAMHDMLTFDQLKRFMVNDIVEVIPLAYMRGRTLNHAAIILDEAQNTTSSQMLMFLTRLGHHSKMIVTGDDSQVDLLPSQTSGLRDAVRRLAGIEGVAILRLAHADIVRHALVQEIVKRYEDPAKSEDGS